MLTPFLDFSDDLPLKIYFSNLFEKLSFKDSRTKITNHALPPKIQNLPLFLSVNEASILFTIIKLLKIKLEG